MKYRKTSDAQRIQKEMTSKLADIVVELLLDCRKNHVAPVAVAHIMLQQAGRLYEIIFANLLNIDMDEIKKRMEQPDDTGDGQTYTG